MALIAADRVRETTATTGTGAYALAGAVTGFRAFSTVLADADTAYYAATDNVNWEVGLGTYTSAGNTLTRTTILASSNAGSAVSWSAGDKAIFLTYPASKSVLSDAANISGSSTVTLLDTNFTLQDDVDPTKQLKFQVANVGTGTTVTLTAPTQNGTILTVTGGQTVSNKTVDNSNTVTLKDTLFTLQDDADTTKQLKFELSSITTANTRTITVPDASGTLMLAGLGQTITGLKTFNDTAFAVRDNTDTTKSFVFEASGITTGTQRTLTVPDASGTIALTSNLGTIASQNANSVTITGGTITGITDLAVADGGTGASTLTGYVKGNGTAAMTASTTIPNTDITGLGTMSTQAASNVAITGGSIQNTTIGGVGVSAVGTFTTLTASTNLIALGTSTLGTANTDTVTANGMIYFQGGTREQAFTVTGTTPDLDPRNGGIQQWTLTANSTPVSPTNWTNGQSITMRIADGTAYTINWTTMGVVWVGGTAPTLATTGYTIVVLFKIGGVIYGSLTGNVA